MIGKHIVLNELGRAIFSDLQRLLPWSFLVIGLLFWIVFRSWVLVALAVVQSGVTVVLTLAILAGIAQPGCSHRPLPAPPPRHPAAALPPTGRRGSKKNLDKPFLLSPPGRVEGRERGAGVRAQALPLGSPVLRK
jgi:hypothetical protein